ncbi:MAG TPA: NAD-dependent epimerase/dehydratase family protein [Solirubrobacteraceae bacterium]|nr:NAD-dependent epimerase/dehydratase family protein [Solirubrobacteraceae bacterium]
MKVLLTGAAGLIGQATARLLHECGHEVLATDLRRMPAGVGPLRWQRLDVRYGGRVRSTFEAFRPEAVVHLAAKHFIPDCNRFPVATLHTNVLGTQNVIEGLRDLVGVKLVLASSAAVYGPSRRPLRETSRLAPDDIYGMSKLTDERLCELAARQQPDLAIVALRLFNTIGPGDPNPHLIPRLVSELCRGAARVRLGNLASVRDYVYVEDVAHAIHAALEHAPGGFTIANVGTGVGRSVGEVISVFEAQLGRSLAVVSQATQRRAVDRPFLVADRSRARELFEWEPRVSFEAGIARTLSAAGLLPAPVSAASPELQAMALA